MSINLGATARDMITGFTGVVTAESRYLHGCQRYCLQPTKLVDGKIVEAMWFDEPQLVVTRDVAPAPAVKTGGPQPAPQRRSDSPVR